MATHTPLARQHKPHFSTRFASASGDGSRGNLAQNTLFSMSSSIVACLSYNARVAHSHPYHTRPYVILWTLRWLPTHNRSITPECERAIVSWFFHRFAVFCVRGGSRVGVNPRVLWLSEMKNLVLCYEEQIRAVCEEIMNQRVPWCERTREGMCMWMFSSRFSSTDSSC